MKNALIFRISLVCSLLLNSISYGQSFVNGGLEGPLSASTPPPGWSQVPASDPVNLANSACSGCATSDVTGLSGPFPAFGVNGNPHSGNSFVSGLLTETHHEGIMQTVSGFTIGQPYTIEFYQACIGQNNATDNSGSWSVYINNTFIGTTTPTTTSQGAWSNNHPWEARSISFTASNSSHTIKFLPTDDDQNYTTPSGIRMGIDDISFPLSLPIELMNFNAEVNNFNNNVILTWTTGSETNSDLFIIEKSRNLIDWAAVHSIEAAGESNQILHYKFEDTDPYEGLSYYRLVQIDINGTRREYSPKSANVNINTFNLSAEPNPFQAWVSISCDPNNASNVLIYNAQGIAIEFKIIFSGPNFIKIDTSNWIPGFYFIKYNELTNTVVKT